MLQEKHSCPKIHDRNAMVRMITKYGVLGLKMNVQTKKYDRLIIPVQSPVKIRERFF